jgi:hypothetical protein
VAADGVRALESFGLDVVRYRSRNVDTLSTPSALGLQSTCGTLNERRRTRGCSKDLQTERLSRKPTHRREQFCIALLSGLGETVSHVLAAVLRAEPDWSALPAHTPAPIRRLLRRCLEKDRKRRLDSAAAARLEIDDALSPTASTATETHPRTPRRGALMLSLGLGAGLIAAVGAYMLGTNASRAASALPAVTRPVIQPPAGTHIVGGHREVAVSADGRQVAFIARGAADQHIYRDTLGGHRRRHLGRQPSPAGAIHANGRRDCATTTWSTTAKQGPQKFSRPAPLIAFGSPEEHACKIAVEDHHERPELVRAGDPAR